MPYRDDTGKAPVAFRSAKGRCFRGAKGDFAAGPRFRTAALALGLTVAGWLTGNAAANEFLPDAPESLKHPGYRLLVEKPFLPAEFDQKAFDHLWETWEAPLRKEAKAATADDRRRTAFARYGLTPRPGESGDMPMQYVSTGVGGWTINCLACHGGKVAGRVMPGLPNSHYAMQTLYDELRTIKLLQGTISRRDVLGAIFPRGGSNGTTNAVMFGVAVVAVRDADLKFDASRPLPKFVHHDVDAPPWWNVKKKKWLYADGSVENGHRALMSFLLASPHNTGERVRGYEKDFKQVYEWILSLRPPKYPFAIDADLAAKGKTVFNETCARCHGTYGPGGKYPNKIVPIGQVGTDRARLTALTPEQIKTYGKTWLSEYGRKKVNADSGGYVAPPLDGIWASAPYFHNGSVPTLWHVLHPDQRPVVWRRSEDGYDRQQVGLEITSHDDIPAEARTAAQRRQYFDTRKFGKSAAGHGFPDALNAAEKRAVLEYLKTL